MKSRLAQDQNAGGGSSNGHERQYTMPPERLAVTNRKIFSRRQGRHHGLSETMIAMSADPIALNMLSKLIEPDRRERRRLANEFQANFQPN